MGQAGLADRDLGKLPLLLLHRDRQVQRFTAAAGVALVGALEPYRKQIPACPLGLSSLTEPGPGNKLEGSGEKARIASSC